MVDIVNIAEEPWCKKFGKTMKKGLKVCAARRRISRDILQRLASLAAIAARKVLL
jgi:hypothetical protein